MTKARLIHPRTRQTSFQYNLTWITSWPAANEWQELSPGRPSSPGLPNSPGRREKKVTCRKIPAESDCRVAVNRCAPNPVDDPMSSPSRIPAGLKRVSRIRMTEDRRKVILKGGCHDLRQEREIAIERRSPWTKTPRKREMAVD